MENNILTGETFANFATLRDPPRPCQVDQVGNVYFLEKLEHWNKLRNCLIYKVKTCSNQRLNLEHLLEQIYKVGTGATKLYTVTP